MITMLGEFGKERGPPFLERGELSPELFQLAVDLRQFGPRLPFPQVSLTAPGTDQILDMATEQPQPRVLVHRGTPILELARVDRRTLRRTSKIPSTGSRQPRSKSRSAALRSGQLARNWSSTDLPFGRRC
jgi:hypothetical protein